MRQTLSHLQSRAIAAGVTLVFVAGVAACSSAEASPTGSLPATSSSAAPTATPTLICNDGGATPMPDACKHPPRVLVPTGIVSARPSRDDGGTSVSPSKSASPWATRSTDPEALAYDATGYFNASIDPGKSYSVDIDFEGTTNGSLAVLSTSQKVSATFGGEALKGSTMMTAWGFQYTADPPKNGRLVVKNGGSTTATVYGYAYIQTRRHLTVTPAYLNGVKGQPVTVTAELSEATGDEGAVAYLTTRTSRTAVAAVKTSAGHWTVTVTPPDAGEYQVGVQTTGSRARIGSATVNASDGDLTVSPTLGERLIDQNGDRFADELELTATITTGTAGKYEMNARLVGEDGTIVGTSGNKTMTLAAGIPAPVTLGFGGEYIYESHRWGPYTLQMTIWRSADTTIFEARDLPVGRTAAYDYLQFQHRRVSVDSASITGKPIDLDGDGLFEAFRVSGSVTVENPGRYQLQVNLRASSPPGDDVGRTFTDLTLEAGPQTVSADIKGSDIAAAGRDGPYSISIFALSVIDSPYPLDDALGWPTFKSPAYKASQFH